MNYGIANFYFTKHLPARAVAIAKVAARPSTAADLTDLFTQPYSPGSLVVQTHPAGDPVDAAVVGHSVRITGSAYYRLENPFFELTNEVDGVGEPLFYQHSLPSPNVMSVSISSLDGTKVTAGWVLRDGRVLHSFAGEAYWISYYEGQVLQKRLLKYDPVVAPGTKASASTYTFTPNGLLGVASEAETYRIRFTAVNGYQVMLPYAAPPNDPWYPRIRFNLRPLPPEWARQRFAPKRPYMLATWVPGKVIDKNLIDFERGSIWFDRSVRQYPDILIYDKSYNLKYALDGVQPNLMKPADKGYLFPWRSGQVLDLDASRGRCHVGVDLASDDIVFGFYSYAERDLIYRDVDINPFSNPKVKDKLIRFFHKEGSPTRVVYHEILDAAGTVVETNDPDPENGDRHDFGQLTVGFSVGENDISFEDIRVRGGGLAPEHQGIEQSRHMWDIGFWDGQPFPLSGVFVVMLPVSLLDRFSRDDIKARVEAVVPMGTLPVIRFYSPEGEEFAL